MAQQDRMGQQAGNEKGRADPLRQPPLIAAQDYNPERKSFCVANRALCMFDTVPSPSESQTTLDLKAPATGHRDPARL